MLIKRRRKRKTGVVVRRVPSINNISFHFTISNYCINPWEKTSIDWKSSRGPNISDTIDDDFRDGIKSKSVALKFHNRFL